MMKILLTFLITVCILTAQYCSSQPLNQKQRFSREDTVRGSITPERAWWDVLHYDVHVTPDFNNRSISGKTTIRYKVITNTRSEYLQIDLQNPLIVDSFYYNNKLYINYPLKPYYNRGNAWYIPLPRTKKNEIHSLTVFYHGTPRPAITPPWDGGWIWQKDDKGRPWMSAAVQGLGASAWFPCKDHQSDEPDNGASLTITVPDTLVAVGNGRLKNQSSQNKLAKYTWEVVNPINNYNIIPYIGKYVNWTDTMMGEKGKLDLSYWVLEHDLQKAKKQFDQVKPTIRAFEYWFGPYPFYEDGFKLIQAPHLGMEHQSAVAYGNKFMNGYLGKDLSGSGWGLKWDFIIVHETGHEWFGNNITTTDIADMWVHEGFTNYSETLFTEFHYGKTAANEYLQGIRKNIRNDKPVIAAYGVNQEGSGDMYYKGANLIHTIRQVINDDEKFRSILRGLNKEFYHKTVTSKQVEEYISSQSNKNLSKIFHQYLRTTQIPVLHLTVDGSDLKYRWEETVDDFNMPVKLTNGTWLQPTSKWQTVKIGTDKSGKQEVDPNFYIKVKRG